MRKTDEKNAMSRRGGFTLLELLVVIAIIMMLLGILVPGMQSMKRASKNLQQKSLFHSLEIAIELFARDFGDYPDSKRTQDPSGSLYYSGAQHLAEAMLGRDEKGYEPIQSKKWYWPGTELPPVGSVTYDLYKSTDKSLNRRKKAYIQLKDTGMYVANELYDTASLAATTLYSDAGDTKPGERGPVLTDVFLKKKITTITPAADIIKVGSPILYYKANRSSRLFKKDGPVPGDKTDKWIYNFKDNIDLIKLKTLVDPQLHHFDPDYPTPTDPEDGIVKFYQAITAPGVSYEKPFNPRTFILISAGNDGIFGTKDDVTNFDY